jgi:hypothetical protein
MDQEEQDDDPEATESDLTLSSMELAVLASLIPMQKLQVLPVGVSQHRILLTFRLPAAAISAIVW